MRQQRDFLEELLHRTFGNLLEHRFRLIVGACLFNGDTTFGIEQFRGNTGCVERLWLRGGDVHRDILAELLVTANDVNENADFRAAMHVRNELALGFDANETTRRHVFADLANQRRTRGFDSAFTHRQRRQRGNVGRVLAGHEFCAALRQSQELVILGDEVGFAVNFDDRTELAVGRNAHGNDAFRGNTRRGLGCLVTQLYTQNFFRLAQIAVSFGQGLLAFHHRRIGLCAQFCHHACGNCRHFLLHLRIRPEIPAVPC